MTDTIPQLRDIMAKLRDPQDGCPWDKEQDFQSIARYTIEEAYEVVDAIDRKEWAELRDELGDLLLQVVFHAQMADEAGYFNLDDVHEAICDKMIRRHPHVFGDETQRDAEAHSDAWVKQKEAERLASGDTDDSALAGITHGLPAWMRSVKLQKRAAKVGFDWPNTDGVIDKLHEELGELGEEMRDNQPAPDRLQDEFGDVLFVMMNLARHLDIDPEAALRHANQKFERRFRGMEQQCRAQNTTLDGMTLDEMEELWQAVKLQQ